MFAMKVGEPLSNGFDQRGPIVVYENDPVLSSLPNLLIDPLEDAFNVVPKAVLLRRARLRRVTA